MRKRILVLIAFALPVLAQDQNWNIHFQATSIGDFHAGFPSPYRVSTACLPTRSGGFRLPQPFSSLFVWAATP